MTNISDKTIDEFMALSEKEGYTYNSREEAREAMQNLVNYFEILIQMDGEWQRYSSFAEMRKSKSRRGIG